MTTTSNEALNDAYFFPFSDQLLQWSSPVNNRLLLEAGIWHHQETWGGSISPFNLADPLAIGVTDNNPSVTPGYTQLVTNYHGRVGSAYTPSHNPNTRTNFAASYVTGSHAFKAGMDFAWAERGAWTGSVVPYSYVVSTVTPGKVGIPVPTTLSLRSDGCNDPLVRQVNGGLTTPVTSYNAALNCPTFVTGKIDGEGGLFAQDRWTMNRITLNLGIRLDTFTASIPGYHLSPSIITPLRNYDVPDYHVRASEGHHAEGGRRMGRLGRRKNGDQGELREVRARPVAGGEQSAHRAQPLHTVLVGTRPWTDNNGDFIPDCDLTNPAAQGPTLTGSLKQVDACGTATALLYANSPTPQKAGDDAARFGWQKRPYSWEFSVSAQHELTKGVSVSGGYFRRWFGNFLVTDDVSQSASDYEAFSVTQSAIPGSPASAGGTSLPGNIYTDGFYVPKPGTVVGATNYVGLSDMLFPGSNVIDHWNGFDVSLNARLGHGIIFQGGTEHRAPGHRQLRHRRSGQRRQVRQPVAARRSADGVWARSIRSTPATWIRPGCRS